MQKPCEPEQHGLELEDVLGGRVVGGPVELWQVRAGSPSILTMKTEVREESGREGEGLRSPSSSSFRLAASPSIL